MKTYSVNISRRAEKMLFTHLEFLKQSSIPAANKLINHFEKSINRIEENPFAFPFADEWDVPNIPPDTYRKCLFYERYKAIYIIEGLTVHIDAIIDTRQENARLY